MSATAMNAWFSALHVIGFMGLAAALSVEAILLRGGASREMLERLVRADLLYGLCALLVLGTGLGRVFWYGKGAAFYLQNWVFHLKVGIFLLVGLWSVLPTVRFLRWRSRCRADGSLPDPVQLAAMRRVVFAEVHLVALLPFLAAFMARGYGYFGG